MRKKMLWLVLPVISLLFGFSQPVKPVAPYACRQDRDCVIKDVRNSCGYYPRCVNKKYMPDINRPLVNSMICGAPDITACKCKNNKCVSMQNEMEV